MDNYIYKFFVTTWWDAQSGTASRTATGTVTACKSPSNAADNEHEDVLMGQDGTGQGMMTGMMVVLTAEIVPRALHTREAEGRSGERGRYQEVERY
jgi:hypothetical protein